MTAWCSLYLPFADSDTLAKTLAGSLTALGYERFDPFGIIPGKAYPQAVRLFVAPPSITNEGDSSRGVASILQNDDSSRGAASTERWTRIIGTPDAALLPSLSLLAPVLLMELDGDTALIEAYAEGEASTVEMAFEPYVRHHDCIRLSMLQTAAPGNATLGGVALDALPDDVQALAQGRVDLGQANAMFKKMSGTLAQKGIEGNAELLRQPDWNSAGGARIRALAACFEIPNWQAPDFVTLRDAYALHTRRRRLPNAALYPGDAETMAAVPDALAYTPIYYGKR